MVNNELLEYDILVKSVTVPVNRSMQIFLLVKYKDIKAKGKSRLIVHKMNPIAQFNESFNLLIKEVSRSIVIEVCSYRNEDEIEVLGSFAVDVNLFEEASKVINGAFKIPNLHENGTITLEIKKHPVIHKEENNVKRIEESHKLENFVMGEGFEVVDKKSEEVQERINAAKTSQGLAETVVVDLVKQSKEKDEIINLVKQKAEEAILELERVKKNNEITESSLRNELAILKQSQEIKKKEINDISDKFLKAKHGNFYTNP